MGLSSLFNGDRPVYVITEQVFVHQFQEFVQDRGKSVMMHMTRQPNHHRQYRVYWCPMPTVLCSTLLQDFFDGLQVAVEMHADESMGFIALDTDLFSLELPLTAEDANSDHPNHYTTLQLLTKSLSSFYNRSPRKHLRTVSSKGRIAAQCADKFLEYSFDPQSSHSFDESPIVNLLGPVSPLHAHEQLLFVDRELDLVSLFVTPLTYEGLLHSITGIHNGIATLDELRLPCTPNDSIFKEIHQQAFENIGPILQSKARLVKNRYDQFRDHKEASIAEIHKFVKQIPALTSDFKSLDQHISGAEKVAATINERMYREFWRWERRVLDDDVVGFFEFLQDVMAGDVLAEYLVPVLRLLCLYSVINRGIKGSVLEQTTKLLVLAYGIRTLGAMKILESAGNAIALAIDNRVTLSTSTIVGYLRRQEELISLPAFSNINLPKPVRGVVANSSTWQVLAKSMQLLSTTEAPPTHDDLEHIAAGYVPLVARFIERLFPSRVLNFDATAEAEDAKRLLGLPFGQVNVKEWVRSKYQLHYAPPNTEYYPDYQAKRNIGIVFTHGASYAEIAALRSLSNRHEFPCSITIFTTHRTNNSIIRGIIPVKESNALM